jgi:hypothetical protein
MAVISLAFGVVFTQSGIPAPSADQQANLQAAMKELKMRRQALHSAATAKLSLVNCGQLALAQSQLETADIRMQLALTKVANQLGLDPGLYEAVEDKDGKVLFRRKQQPASPTPSPNLN